MFFTPLTLLLYVIFFVLLLFFFAIVQVNVIALVFTKIGIPSEYIFTALFGSLLGGFINIPVKEIAQPVMTEKTIVNFFGIRYTVPVRRRNVTVIAVNLGGAIVPVVLSGYLLVKTGLWGEAAIATLIMSVVSFRLARPVEGLGIALPPLLPAMTAALVAVVIAYQQAPVIAYIGGTLGTLIGADILNLPKIEKLGAPVVSIGGAGTFDGIFLNGIIAVLLAALLA